MHKSAVLVAGLVLVAQPVISEPAADQQTPTPRKGVSGVSAARSIVDAVAEPSVRDLLSQVLLANPDLDSATAQIEATQEFASVAGVLTDPTLSWTAFVATPETRTGAQQGSVSVAQNFPWPGTLALRRELADLDTLASRYRRDTLALGLLTQARELHFELLFLDEQRRILSEKREHLNQHEEISRSRYATGSGRGQDVIKLQAEISRVESQSLMVETQMASLATRLNQLRDQPGDTPLPLQPIAPTFFALPPGHDLPNPWIASATGCRPEVLAADSAIRFAELQVDLVEKRLRPDFTLGLGYTLVNKRDDPQGRAMPPQGNGDDIVALHGSVRLPVRRQRIAAEVSAAEQRQRVALSQKQALKAAIRAEVENSLARIPLAWSRLRITEDLLLIQAEESLESARASYIAGGSSALDLLDAEHILFEARSSIARAQADYQIEIARLEGALGIPAAKVAKGCSS